MKLLETDKVETPFPTVEPNLRCIRYDCQDCHGKGYVEGWIGVDPAALRCPGNGVVEHWKALTIARVRENLTEWSGYTAVKPMPSAAQTDPDAILFTARNREDKRVELRADRDPDVVAEPKKPTEYYFNIWERPAGTTEGWEWISAIEADLKPKPKQKGA